MEGLKLGLMPFGDIIGSSLPKKLPLPGVLTVAFLLGIGCTYAEPAIGTLQVAGSIVDPTKAPYLYTMLNAHAPYTVLLVGLGVGVAAVLGTVRFLYDWSLKPLIYLSLLPGVILTGYCAMDPELATIIGLAWDCGGVTTGPVTVPLVLALGIGVANSGGKGNSQLSGFGIVTLASIYPIVAVLSLGIYLKFTLPVADILVAAEASKAAAAAVTNPAWYEASPGLDIKMGIQAIVPLVLFLLIVLFVVLREKLPNAFIIVAGLIMCVLGMCTFNVGLTYGLAALGSQTGSLIPIAFVSWDGSPALYSPAVGMFLAAGFAERSAPTALITCARSFTAILRCVVRLTMRNARPIWAGRWRANRAWAASQRSAGSRLSARSPTRPGSAISNSSRRAFAAIIFSILV